MKRSAKPSPWLKRPITDLALPARVLNALGDAGYRQVSDVVSKTKRDVMMLPNFGVKSLADLTAALEARGLRLDMLPREEIGLPAFVELERGWVLIEEDRRGYCRGEVKQLASRTEKLKIGDFVAYYPGRKVPVASGFCVVPCKDVVGRMNPRWVPMTFLREELNEVRE